MANKRVKDLTTDTSLSAGDYVLLDSASEGTRKFDLGAELNDLKEDIENISGISDDVKTALLAIAQNVVYKNADADYTQNLYDALYPVALTSISAVYTQSGTVYDTDTLDSLKADLVVTATYDDSSTAVVTAYTLSGTLEVGTSTITVSYGGKTTTFTVTVTQEILYTLPSSMTFNGSSDYVDTGVKLLENDIDFTIAFTETNGAIAQQNTLFHCMTEDLPYPGMSMMRTSTSGKYDIGGLKPNGTQTACKYASGTTNKCVFRHTAGTNVYTLSSKTGSTLNSVLTIQAVDGYVTTAKNLLIGCYQQTNGTKGRFWPGTINDFTIYARVLSDAEVTAYLGGS